jgi:hypothetical protein
MENDNPILEKVRKDLKAALAAEWVLQGHRLTGEFEDEIEVITTEKESSLQIDVLMLKRGKALELGRHRTEISITGAYIAGLIDYVRKRMEITDSKKAKSVAFAIAKTHQKEGMPSKKSRRFSKTGKRTGFVNETIRKNSETFARLMKEYAKRDVEIRLDLLLRKWKKTFNTTKTQ